MTTIESFFAGFLTASSMFGLLAGLFINHNKCKQERENKEEIEAFIEASKRHYEKFHSK